MSKISSIIGCLVSFILAGVVHFNIASLSNKKNPALPAYIYKDIDAEIEDLELYRLICFSVGVFLMFFTIYLFNRKTSSDAEILDDGPNEIS